MPNVVRNVRRVSHRGRRGRRRARRLTVRTLARKVRHLERETKPERKFIDVAETQVPVTLVTSPIVPILLNQITQGVTAGQRIGEIVNISSIQLDYVITPIRGITNPPLVAGPSLMSLVRFIVVWFPDTGEATVNTDFRNVLEQISIVQSFYKRNGPVKYRVLHDKTYQIEFASTDSTTVAPLSDSTHQCRVNLRLDKTSTYLGATNQIAKGTLVYYAAQELFGSAISLADISVRHRLTYEDP